MELAPVLRFLRLFVYEKGRVHKHKPPRRKAVSEHSERTLETEGFPRWGVGVCARGGKMENREVFQTGVGGLWKHLLLRFVHLFGFDNSEKVILKIENCKIRKLKKLSTHAK
ncbi:hypothetical protein C4556_01995 [Candidatus Parcubacteria bacterium]|nr:MAG: hypothetical protein C4556_01995 [Candidatus Parcubacteria bacterium]